MKEGRRGEEKRGEAENIAVGVLVWSGRREDEAVCVNVVLGWLCAVGGERKGGRESGSCSGRKGRVSGECGKDVDGRESHTGGNALSERLTRREMAQEETRGGIRWVV